MKKIIVLFVLASYCAVAQAEPPYGEALQRHRTLLEVLPVTSEDIIFIGNSITYGGEWAELFNNIHVKNRGIGGDRAEWLYDRVDYLIAGQPKKLFMMIGINDLSAGREPGDVIADIRNIVEMFEKGSPTTEIYIQSILPINDVLRPVFNNFKHNIPIVNDGLRKMCDEKGIVYIDLHPVLADDQGRLDTRYTLDGLHLTGKGYLVWTEAIRQYVE